MEIKIPVPIACVDLRDIPAETPSAWPGPNADIARKAAGLAADLRNLDRENFALRAALMACATMGRTQ